MTKKPDLTIDQIVEKLKFDYKGFLSAELQPMYLEGNFIWYTALAISEKVAR